MSDRRERQLEIVLNLNKLTKQRKIVWSPVFPPLRIGGKTEFVSVFKNRRYYLTDAPPVSLLELAISRKPFFSLLAERMTSRFKDSKFSLFIQEDGEEIEIWIHPMPATDDLASTVRFQLEDTQDLDEILRDLEEAETLLEG